MHTLYTHLVIYIHAYMHTHTHTHTPIPDNYYLLNIYAITTAFFFSILISPLLLLQLPPFFSKLPSLPMYSFFGLTFYLCWKLILVGALERPKLMLSVWSHHSVVSSHCGLITSPLWFILYYCCSFMSSLFSCKHRSLYSHYVCVYTI